MHPEFQQLPGHDARRPAAPRHCRRRRRGSVLIFVVALLTLVALIGTALIATARIDRRNTVVHVDMTTDATTHKRFTDMLSEKVFRAISRGYGKDVDSARTDSWLGDRLPVPAQVQYYNGNPVGTPTATAADTPVWRFTSGIIDRYDADLFQNEYWRPPLQLNPAAPVSLIDTLNPQNSLVKLDGANPGFAMVPSSISVTYPNDHPVESIRGKTRTFPAGFFVDRKNGAWPPTGTTLNPGSVAQPHLMGDADGDGVADSALFQISPSPVNGVTYYGAIRVIDNNSAINVNTAYARTADILGDGTKSLWTSSSATGYDTSLFAPAATGQNNGFFPSDIGLVELLDPYNGYLKYGTNTPEGSGREARANEMAELDEYRLGYQTDFLHSDQSDAGGWCDAFEDFMSGGSGPNRTAPAIRPMRVSYNKNVSSTINPGQLVAVEDRMQDPGDYTSPNSQWNPDPDGSTASDAIGNWSVKLGNPDSRIRPDFIFTTQNEALYTMASRRWESIRYGVDLNPAEGSGSFAGSGVAAAGARANQFPTATPYNLDSDQGDEIYNNKQIAGLSRAGHGLFPYRWFDEQEAGSLAYRFCLVDPNGNQSTIESILRHSAYRSAPNWKPGLSDSNPTWSFYPANEYIYWFQALNWDGDLSQNAPYNGADGFTGGNYPEDLSYFEKPSWADQNNGASIVTSAGKLPRFRSVRPLLTTHNPVNTSYVSATFLHANDYGFQHNSTDAKSTGIDWNLDTVLNERNTIYPGMLLNDMVNLAAGTYRVPEPWQPGIQYSMGDMVYDKTNRITWMCVKDTTDSQGVSPWSIGNTAGLPKKFNIDISNGSGEYLYWEPQSWVSGNSKASVNVAGFPELWRAYYNVMTQGSVADAAVDANLKAEIDGYASSIVPPNQGKTDDYAFFPLTASDPLGAAATGSTVNDPNVFYLRFYDPYRGMRFHINDTTGTPVDPATGLPVGNLNEPTFDPAIANQPETNNYTSNLPPSPTNPPPASVVYETNKLGMFRSVIRDPRPVRPTLTAPLDPANPDEYITLAKTGVDSASITTATNTIRGDATHSPQERLTPLQMATLRSAIAAFNAQDMLNAYGLRDQADVPQYNIQDVPAKTIVLYDTNREFPNPTVNGDTGNPGPDHPRPQYEVTIYANRPQPFISEVFATNDTHVYKFPDTQDPLDDGTPAQKQYCNPSGYVAIELHNPYPVAIDTHHWVITSIDRRSSANGGDFGQATHQLGGAGGTLRIDFNSLNLTSIPAGGTVVIESYAGSAPQKIGDITTAATDPYSTREYRPPASGIVPLYDPSDAGTETAQWIANPTKNAGSYPVGVVAPGCLDPENNSAPPKQILRYGSSQLTAFLVPTNAQELVILRPRKSNPTVPPVALEDMVPVDQFDFTGSLPASTSRCQSIHYARNTNGWQVVYPGRYDGLRNNDPNTTNYGPRRFQGTCVTPTAARIYNPDGGDVDPWVSPAYHSEPFSYDPFKLTAAQAANARYGGMTFGLDNSRPNGTGSINLTTIRFNDYGALSGVAAVVQQYLPIPLLGTPLAFNPMLTTAAVAQTTIQHPSAQAANQFPFGGFARNGDILQVPFIAAYRIRKFESANSALVPTHRAIGVTGIDGVRGINPGQLDGTFGTFLEMNSISMDAAFAEDTDPSNDANPAIAGSQPVSETVGRINPGATSATAGWPAYAWGANLFRYLDVHVPANDYLPDANPALYPPGSIVTNAGANARQTPKPVNNRPGSANLSIAPNAAPGSSENSLLSQFPTDETAVASQGLININTAPRKVLSMLPIVAGTGGNIDVANTQAAAKDIFDYVTQKGDIRTLFDLNRVSAKFTGSASSGYAPYSGDQTKQGDVYPIYDDTAGTTGATQPEGFFAPGTAAGGIKQQYLLMNRISNLVTTKSDTFTVYLLVQGWREAGTQFPVLDWEKRQAFIVDRSTGTLRITKVPTD